MLDRTDSVPDPNTVDLYKSAHRDQRDRLHKTVVHKQHYCKCGSCLKQYHEYRKLGGKGAASKGEGKGGLPYQQKAKARRKEKAGYAGGIKGRQGERVHRKREEDGSFGTEGDAGVEDDEDHAGAVGDIDDKKSQEVFRPTPEGEKKGDEVGSGGKDHAVEADGAADADSDGWDFVRCDSCGKDFEDGEDYYLVSKEEAEDHVEGADAPER